jgi:sigma-B regulation protein RsbU (phosphoserine phosphatase)
VARLLSREIAEPERILERLNDEVAADNPSGMFVTFLCGIYHPASNHLAVANAGHCRPVVLRADGTAHWAVKELGTALGFECGLQFERTDVPLGQGDTLILYTDGVSEAFNNQEECYGDKRLLADAIGFARGSAIELSSGLLQKVRAFAGSAPQSDDIAILTMKIGRDKSARAQEACA